MSSISRQQLERYLQNVDVKGSILDIGGSQKALQGRTKSYNPSEYLVMDIEGNPDYKHDICVPAKFEELFAFRKDKFDQIFCLEVSEYFVNPCTAVLNMSDWLKEGGELYISLHLTYPEHKPEGTDMLRYTKNWINKVFKEYFKVVEITPRVATRGLDLLRGFYQEEQMKAFKDIEEIGYIVKAVK